jgi:NADH-quinone oxidoreductase subunit H
MIQDLVIYLLYMGYAIGFMLGLATLFTWVERKQSAVMADRIGANRCYIRLPFTNIKLVTWGLFHGIADGAKMLPRRTRAAHPTVLRNLAPAAAAWSCWFSVVPSAGP